MTNKEKFLLLVSEEDTKTITEVKQRIKNREMLRESQQIAIKVLMKLDLLGWSQKTLAEKMKVSPQQINKIVSGKENLTLETQIKLQNILDIPVLASYFDNLSEKITENILTFSKKEEYTVTNHLPCVNYNSGKVFNMKVVENNQEYSYQECM